MGLLNDLRESAARINPALSMTEDKDSAIRHFRDSKITRAARIFDEGTFYDPREKRERRYAEWTGLGELLESDNPRQQWKAASCTLESIAKTQNFIEQMKDVFGESTVQTSLGALNPRVLDVVCIFYPNQVATELLDIQPIDGQVGEIFVMKPLFSNSLPSGTVGPVTAGDQIFTKPTYSYANEVTTEMMGFGGTQSYAYSCGKTPVRPNTVKIMAVIAGNTDVTVDNGSGGLIGLT
jgi:hypothetical protein